MTRKFPALKNFPKLKDAQEKKGKELETHQIYNYSFVSASTRFFFVVSFNMKSLVISRFVTFWWRLLLLLRLKRRC